MTQYITRVELHKGKWPEDYDKLHEEMKREGFTNVVTHPDGTLYELPTAEYFKLGNNNSEDDAMAAAKRASSKIGKRYSILLSKAERILFYDLDKAKK